MGFGKRPDLRGNAGEFWMILLPRRSLFKAVINGRFSTPYQDRKFSFSIVPQINLRF
jgi:hypothetical protein